MRALIVTNWDLGFPLTSRPPIPDVAPGEAYVTEVIPQSPITIREVIVEGFALVQISVGSRTITATLEEQGPRRLYRLHEPIDVGTETGMRIHLCNDSDVPRKQKIVTLIKMREARVETERKL